MSEETVTAPPIADPAANPPVNFRVVLYDRLQPILEREAVQAAQMFLAADSPAGVVGIDIGSLRAIFEVVVEAFGMLRDVCGRSLSNEDIYKLAKKDDARFRSNMESKIHRLMHRDRRFQHLNHLPFAHRVPGIGVDALHETAAQADKQTGCACIDYFENETDAQRREADAILEDRAYDDMWG